MSVHEVSIIYDVRNEPALFQAAFELALECNVEEHIATELLRHKDGRVKIDSCLLMLVDRGRLPGCETIDSTAEQRL